MHEYHIFSSHFLLQKSEEAQAKKTHFFMSRLLQISSSCQVILNMHTNVLVAMSTYLPNIPLYLFKNLFINCNAGDLIKCSEISPQQKALF